MKKLTALLLILALLLCGCGAPKPETKNLMEEVPARVICLAEQPECSAEATDFALRLFQCSLKAGENTLISPLSVLSALAMTANGAEGETLRQMEEALGMTTGDMNAYLYSFMDGQGDALKLANSIWFKDSESLTVEQTFLETNADFFMADIFKTPMDSSTKDAINGWVSEHTDGMIPEILDDIPDLTVMYLVNALAFEAQWETVYEEYQVQANIFTTENGDEQPVDMMYSKESLYLEDENATGFIKYYDGRDYAFVALLPKEGVSVEAYVDSLTGAQLQELLSAPIDVQVDAGIPKFETEFDAELSEALVEMGMTDAFDANLADFSRISSSTSLYINRVLHKTFLTVAEEGTKAGAATAVEMRATGAMPPQDRKIVILNRPFVYMLIDCEENLPFFIGTLMDAE